MLKKKRLTGDSAESAVDVFEAVRRALVRRGLVRQKKGSRDNPGTLEHPKRLSDVAAKSHEILFKATTVFPFVLVPDTVTLDREKLTIATRYFFRVAKITSTPIRDILSAEVDVGPFFGSVHVSSKFFVSGPYSINFMHKKDAMRLQRLLQGYVIVQEQDIETAHIETDKLIAMLEKLGRGDVA